MELENPAPNRRGGKRGTGKPSTNSQMQFTLEI